MLCEADINFKLLHSDYLLEIYSSEIAETLVEPKSKQKSPKSLLAAVGAVASLPNAYSIPFSQKSYNCTSTVLPVASTGFDYIIVKGGLLGGSKDQEFSKLRFGCFNMNGGLDKKHKQLAIQRFIVEHGINVLFLLETNYDGSSKPIIYGCQAISDVLYDARNAPHYGVAVYTNPPQLASQMSLLHIDN